MCTSGVAFEKKKEEKHYAATILRELVRSCSHELTMSGVSLLCFRSSVSVTGTCCRVYGAPTDPGQLVNYGILCPKWRYGALSVSSATDRPHPMTLFIAPKEPPDVTRIVTLLQRCSCSLDTNWLIPNEAIGQAFFSCICISFFPSFVCTGLLIH